MLEEHASLPHRWVSGDDEMGRSTVFRKALRCAASTMFWPCRRIRVEGLNAPPPTRGRWTRKALFRNASRWPPRCPRMPGRSSPCATERKVLITVAHADPCASLQRDATWDLEEVATRELQADGTFKHDYYFAFCSRKRSLIVEFGAGGQDEHRVEDCLQRAKGQVGLADYEVRNWRGWHHHQTLALMATWF